MIIEEGTDVKKKANKSYYTLDINLKQVNFLDRRVYEREEGVYYPSVTSILNFMPKDKWFEEWLKDVGHNADLIRNKAGREGSQVHEAAERLIDGEQIDWMDKNGRAIYNLKVWEMINRFVDFWKTVAPEPVHVEQFLYSDEHKFAGTTDLVVKMGDELWMLDIKTSNSLHRTYDMQLAAYSKAFEEITGNKIDRAGIIWLKSAKRGPGKKKDSYQGAGWEIKFVNDIDVSFEEFLLVYEIFKLENKNLEPKFRSYPTSLKL